MDGPAVSDRDLSSYSAVIFDLDGTLVDTKKFPLVASRNLFMRLGITSEPLFQRYLSALVTEYFRLLDSVIDGAPYMRPWEIVRGAVAFGLESVGVEVDDETLDAAADEFSSLHLELPTLYPGSEELLSILAERGVRLAVITNSFEDHTDPILRRTGIRDYFDVLIDSGVTRTFKPDPRAFLAALDGLEARPQDALVVGDEYYADIVGAHRAGIDAVWVNIRGDSLDEHLRRFGGDTAPAFVVDTIAELRDLFEGC